MPNPAKAEKKPSKIKAALAKLGNAIGEALGKAFTSRS